MKKMIMNYVAAAAASVLLAGNATGAIMMVDWQDGTPGHTYTGWNNPAGAAFGNIDQPPGLGFAVDPGTGGDITIAQNFDVPAPYGSVFYTTDFSPVNMSPIDGASYGLTFTFSGAEAPSGLGAYFQSGVSSYWFYDITSFGASGTYEVGLGSASGWSGYGDLGWNSAPGESFSVALAEVTAIGMFVYYNDLTLGGESYQFTDVGYGMVVPEPGMYVVLGMALLSVAFIFRKRITVSLAEARAMMQM